MIGLAAWPSAEVALANLHAGKSGALAGDMICLQHLCFSSQAAAASCYLHALSGANVKVLSLAGNHLTNH